MTNFWVHFWSVRFSYHNSEQRTYFFSNFAICRGTLFMPICAFSDIRISGPDHDYCMCMRWTQNFALACCILYSRARRTERILCVHRQPQKYLFKTVDENPALRMEHTSACSKKKSENSDVVNWQNLSVSRHVIIFPIFNSDISKDLRANISSNTHVPINCQEKWCF